jgi:hypothetical protein
MSCACEEVVSAFYMGLQSSVHSFVVDHPGDTQGVARSLFRWVHRAGWMAQGDNVIVFNIAQPAVGVAHVAHSHMGRVAISDADLAGLFRRVVVRDWQGGSLVCVVVPLNGGDAEIFGGVVGTEDTEAVLACLRPRVSSPVCSPVDVDFDDAVDGVLSPHGSSPDGWMEIVTA